MVLAVLLWHALRKRSEIYHSFWQNALERSSIGHLKYHRKCKHPLYIICKQTTIIKFFLLINRFCVSINHNKCKLKFNGMEFIIFAHSQHLIECIKLFLLTQWHTDMPPGVLNSHLCWKYAGSVCWIGTLRVYTSEHIQLCVWTIII